MRMKFLFIAFLFLSKISFCQNTADSLGVIQVSNAIKDYNEYTGQNAPVYNGSEYIYYIFSMEGDPFFTKDPFGKGWIEYDGYMYTPPYIFYDIHRNLVVIRDTLTSSPVIMENERVDSFSINDHVFIKLQRDHVHNLYNTGFYEVLYRSDNIQLLCMRSKEIENLLDRTYVVRKFYEKNKYFIYKKGLYYQVSNKKEVLNLFSDRKSAFKKEMRKEHLKIKKRNFENALTRATEIYDGL